MKMTPEMPGSAFAKFLPSRLMPSEEYDYTGDLGSVIDRTHACFDRWARECVFPAGIKEETVERLRLAVHEWVANLVQHAEFDGRAPEIHVRVWPDGETLCCVVEDNSEGFDLKIAGHVGEVEQHVRALRERGLGLMLLRAVAAQLDYQRETGEWCRLRLCVDADAKGTTDPPAEKEGSSTDAPQSPSFSGLTDWQIALSQSG